jgi:hypothetical protein
MAFQLSRQQEKEAAMCMDVVAGVLVVNPPRGFMRLDAQGLGDIIATRLTSVASYEAADVNFTLSIIECLK